MTETAGYEARVERDWVIPQGADAINAFRPYHLVDDAPTYFDLTQPGWSARAQIRKVVGDTPLVEMLSTAETGARIELDADGWVTLVIPAAVSEAEAWNGWGRGRYDVELVDPDGGVVRLARGKVTVSPDVTRNV